MFTDIYNILRSPQSALAHIAEEGTLGKAFLIQIVIYFLSGIVGGIGDSADLAASLSDGLRNAAMSIVFTFIMAGLSHGIAGFMNGAGTWKKQFITFGYCAIPELVVLPLLLIALCAGLTEIHSAIFYITYVWCLILNVYAVEAVQKIGTLKACIALLVPYVAISGIVAGVAVRSLM